MKVEKVSDLVIVTYITYMHMFGYCYLVLLAKMERICWVKTNFFFCLSVWPPFKPEFWVLGTKIKSVVKHQWMGNTLQWLVRYCKGSYLGWTIWTYTVSGDQKQSNTSVASYGSAHAEVK